MARKTATRGPCIVCGAITSDRSHSGGRRHWRCADGEECAVRRNRARSRPRPESSVRAEWRERHSRPARSLNPNPYLEGAWARHLDQKRRGEKRNTGDG